MSYLDKVYAEQDKKRDRVRERNHEYFNSLSLEEKVNLMFADYYERKYIDLEFSCVNYDERKESNETKKNSDDLKKIASKFSQQSQNKNIKEKDSYERF